MKDILRVGIGNIIFLLLSMLMTLFLPFILTVQDFGYWQLFYFYSSFAGLIMLGFNDGIHLKYAGINIKDTKDLPLKSYLIFNILFAGLLSVLLIVIILYMDFETERKSVFILLGVYAWMFNINSFFNHLYLITQQFKRYSFLKYAQRFIFLTLIIILYFLSDHLNFKLIIITYLFATLIIILINVFLSYNILNSKTSSTSLKDIKDNFIRGFPLTVAAIISMLLIGYPRIIIDNNFTIEIFSIYSLASSMLTMIIIVILSISTVLYPKLNNKSNIQINSSMDKAAKIVSPILILSFLSYFILIILLKRLLPQYLEVLEFIHLIMPLVYFQAMFNIIIVNLFKIFDFEKKLLVSNSLGLIFNILITYTSFSYFGTIKSIAFTSTTMYCVFFFFSLIYISKLTKWNYKKSIFVIDLIFMAVFIISIEFLKETWMIFIILICTTFYISYVLKENKLHFKILGGRK